VFFASDAAGSDDENRLQGWFGERESVKQIEVSL
jgi:hypothetical protein